MIQTKTEINYGDRNEKTGKIKLEVRPLETKISGTNYLVIDWDGLELNEAWKSKIVMYENTKKNQVNDYIESIYDLSSFTYTEKEWFKVIVGLMLDTQTNLFENGKTIYQLEPTDWEYSPESIIMFPILNS